MTQQEPAITISSLDAQRLRSLLDSGEFDHLPSVDALSDELDRAHIVQPQALPADVVSMNSTVRFIDDASGQSMALKLLYPDAFAQRLGLKAQAAEQGQEAVQSVSVLAPVGSALLGLAVGQSIVWQVPGGKQLQLRILQVLHQPEAQGDYLL